MDVGFVQWIRGVGDSPMALMVVAILVIMSLATFTISVERWWSFKRMRLATIDVLPEVTRALDAKDMQAALEATKRQGRSHLAKILLGGIQEYLKHEAEKDEFDLLEAVERSLDRSIALTRAELRRGLPLLATVASSAPFVGLTGTVSGIIHAFEGMAISGSGGLGAVSAGIAEALYTTLLGLIVAILAVWQYNYFISRIEIFQVEMTNSASELSAYLMKRLGRSAQGRWRSPSR